MSSRRAHSISIVLRVGFERRSRCETQLVPALSRDHSREWCATSSSSPRKEKKGKKVTFSQRDLIMRQNRFWEEWLNCLFLCQQDYSTAIASRSRQPAATAFSAAAPSPPKLLFNVSLPSLNNGKLQWSCEWRIRQQQTAQVACFQLHTYYPWHRLFGIQATSS